MHGNSTHHNSMGKLISFKPVNLFETLTLLSYIEALSPTQSRMYKYENLGKGVT